MRITNYGSLKAREREREPLRFLLLPCLSEAVRNARHAHERTGSGRNNKDEVSGRIQTREISLLRAMLKKERLRFEAEHFRSGITGSLA